MVTDLIKNYGFPIAVATWALWRLDKSWGKNESIHITLSAIEDSVDRVEETIKQNTAVLAELVTTIRIIQTIIGGEIKK